MRLEIGNWKWAMLLFSALSGCVGQDYVSHARLENGLVIVLPGIEGPSPFNQAICDGLAMGRVPAAIDLYDWTGRWGPVATLRDEERNRFQARQVAARVRHYRANYPGRPVFLVGQSGGGAIAVWAAEALPEGEAVDGIVLLAVSLSPGYRLDAALAHSRRGIVSFHSERDWLFLSVGTQVLATMDGEHTESAGREAFLSPPPNDPAAALYSSKLYEIGWNARMAGAGNFGLHLTSGASEFVKYYVAPLLLSGRWDAELTARLLNGEWVDPARFPELPAAEPAAAPPAQPPPAPTTRPATPPAPASQPADDDGGEEK